ncbi:hypothetical protein GCM10020370_13650 [Paenibacillus hodogayensis]
MSPGPVWEKGGADTRLPIRFGLSGACEREGERRSGERFLRRGAVCGRHGPDAAGLDIWIDE